VRGLPREVMGETSMIIYKHCAKITVLGEAAGRERLDQFLFETAVVRVLDAIQQTRVGQILLKEIDTRPHEVTLIPFRDTQPTNASSSAAGSVVDTGVTVEDSAAARTKRGTPVLVPDYSKLGVCKDKPYRVNGKILWGRGTGTDEIVQFTPRHWGGQFPRLTAETVLVHELTHALRAKMGVTQKRQTCNAYDNQEEFFAILVENLFRSECRKNGQALLLRWHHVGFTELPPKLANLAFFFKFHKAKIRQIEKEMPQFAGALRNLSDLAFNPFAQKNQVG
jgi:hypothetical protein